MISSPSLFSHQYAGGRGIVGCMFAFGDTTSCTSPGWWHQHSSSTDDIDPPSLHRHTSLVSSLSVADGLLNLRTRQIPLDCHFESRMSILAEVQERRVWRKSFKLDSRINIRREASSHMRSGVIVDQHDWFSRGEDDGTLAGGFCEEVLEAIARVTVSHEISRCTRPTSPETANVTLQRLPRCRWTTLRTGWPRWALPYDRRVHTL